MKATMRTKTMGQTSWRLWLLVSSSLAIICLAVGFGIGNNVNSASPSGTSIPISKGGTSATNASDALANLLPSYSGNDGKVLGLTSGTPTWTTLTPDIQLADNTASSTLPDTTPQSPSTLLQQTRDNLKYINNQLSGYGTQAYPYRGARTAGIYMSNTSSYTKIYHGEGVPSGSMNSVTLLVKNFLWTSGAVEQHLVKVVLNTNTSISSFSVIRLFRSPTSSTFGTLFNISGTVSSYDIYAYNSASWITVELWAADEVSVNDTVMATVTTTAPTFATGFTKTLYASDTSFTSSTF